MDFDSLTKLKFFNTYSKRISVLSIIAIILSLFIATADIGKTQDIRTEARVSYTGNVPPGCSYIKPRCPANLSGEQARIGCKPILVCPTATPSKPSLKLSCSDCLGGQKKILCFDRLAKASYCSEFPIVDSGAFCVSCFDTQPTPNCVPPPPCVYTEPRCLLPEPIGGWCKTTPTPEICLQIVIPARNKLTGECKLFPTSCLPDGWVADRSCVPSPTLYSCPTPPPCPGGTLLHGDPGPNVPRCPKYFCIESTPSGSIMPLPQQ